MTAGEPITVECPKCGDHFKDWFRQCANLELDPDLADPGYLDCAATATCPHCGCSIRLGVLTADGDVWRHG
jgi:phage terminase large subunit GpA-like protein